MLDSRRYPRVPFEGLISISWKTFEGPSNHALGKCLDVSEQGVGLELPSRIPVGSFVKVKAEALNLDCSAFVRHVYRKAGRYILGLELSKPLDADILADLLGSHADELTALSSPAEPANLSATAHHVR